MFLLTKYNPLPISRIERNGKREKFDNDKIPAILSTRPPFVLMLIDFNFFVSDTSTLPGDLVVSAVTV